MKKGIHPRPCARQPGTQDEQIARQRHRPRWKLLKNTAPIPCALCLLPATLRVTTCVFNWERVEGTRNFANKIWNASRFALMNMEGYDKDAELAPYTLADKWILSRLQDTVKDVTGLLERFELGEAGRAIYDFIWSEVCDWYIEIAKPRLYNKEAAAERATAQHVLATVLVSAMKLLHPYMPFITEEIYQCLPHEAESIMISKWPVADESLVDPKAERGMNAIMDSIKAIRNMRAEVNANPGKKIPAIMLVSEDLREVVAHNDSYIKLLGGIDNLELRPLNGEKAGKCHGSRCNRH